MTDIEVKDAKSCPFCGSRIIGSTFTHVYWLFCAICKAQGPIAGTRESAKTAWDRRPNQYGRDPSGRWA